MTREEAKELLPIIQEFAEGKIIEMNFGDNIWKAISNPDFKNGAENYRIKPEQKYRPFKTQEECWDEMLKHKPLGWVKYCNSSCIIQNISFDGIVVIKGQEIHYLNFEKHFMN